MTRPHAQPSTRAPTNNKKGNEAEHPASAGRLARLHRAAIAWLHGEGEYQFNKFPLTREQALHDLEPGIKPGIWGSEFGNYTRRARIFADAIEEECEGIDSDRVRMQLLQAAGKTAATGRGLYTVFRFWHQPDMLKAELLGSGLSLLANTEPATLAYGEYSELPAAVGGTLLGKALDALDMHVAQRRPASHDTCITADGVVLAERVYMASAALLLDTMVRWSPDQGPPMPRPGVTSGTIKPWVTYRA